MTPARRALVAKVVIVVAALGTLGRGAAEVFPFLAWPMYHDRGATPVPTEITQYELRVLAEDGRVLGVLGHADLYGLGRVEAGSAVLTAALGDPARSATEVAELDAYLLDVVTDRFGPAAAVEGWRLTWTVDVGATPPLERDEPTAEVLVRTIEGTDR